MELVNKFINLWSTMSASDLELASTIEAIYHITNKITNNQERKNFMEKVHAWFHRVFEQFDQSYDSISV